MPKLPPVDEMPLKRMTALLLMEIRKKELANRTNLMPVELVHYKKLVETKIWLRRHADDGRRDC